MADEAGRLPQSIDLHLYAGDSAMFTLTITDDDEVPIDATVGQWDAQIKVVGAVAISEAFTVSVDGSGRVVLFLDGDTSQRLGELDDDDQQRLRWDLQQTFDDSTVTTHAQGFLIVSPDVTRINLDVTLLETEDGDLLVTELGEELVA